MLRTIVNIIKKKLRDIFYEKFIYYWQKITQTNEGNCASWYKLGELLGTKGHWLEAKKAFLRALYFNRRNPQYLYALGYAQEQLGDSEGALNLYEKALRHNHDCVQALLAKGNILMQKQNFAEAVQCFYKLINLRTKNPDIYNNLGLCFLHLKNLELAEFFLEKAVTLKPKEVVYAYNYGIVLIKKEKYKKAIAVMSKHVNKERAEIFSSLGYCYSSLGMYVESLSNYKKALLLAPHQKENLVNLACIYARMGENMKALEIFKKLLRVNPYDAQLFNNLAWIYENLKNYGEAEKNYYRGLALSPQDPNLLHNLLCCLFKQNKHCEAMQIISVLKRIPEWSNLAWSSLAHIYEKFGEKSLAVDCYNRALGLN